MRPKRRKKEKKHYKDFINRYLTRGVAGVSMGLAAIAPASVEATALTDEQESSKLFSDQLLRVRSTVSDNVNEPVLLVQTSPAQTSPAQTSPAQTSPAKVAPTKIAPAAAGPIPFPPPPPPPPFKNFFGKAPFQDTFRNVPQPQPKPKATQTLKKSSTKSLQKIQKEGSPGPSPTSPSK
jgi:hypothetical protein